MTKFLISYIIRLQKIDYIDGKIMDLEQHKVSEDDFEKIKRKISKKEDIRSIKILGITKLEY